MRIIMFDVDTLRPDHMSCYGYQRKTTPNLDRIAHEGCMFTNYHCSDAPCLPSRAALLTGKFGIHNGAIGHGNTRADLSINGNIRDFRDPVLENGFFNIFRKAGFRTVSISPFAERHSSFWFTAGINELYNTGKCGLESAEEILPTVLDWLDRNAEQDQWFLHINLWDPHTPYRAPAEFGNPFADEPIPDWITEEVFEAHKRHVGPHCINEIMMWHDQVPPCWPRHPGKIEDYENLRVIFDGYDCGIRYMDQKIGEILHLLEGKGIYDDVAFIITSDHGENIGELGIYAEHGFADEITTRIPMILKFPGFTKKQDDHLHYNIDILPTLADYFDVSKSNGWDGESYYTSLIDGEYVPREYLVLSQCAHVCQRSVRFGPWLYMRTYHGGFHLFPQEMLFNIEEDFHEQHNLVEDRPDICAVACRYLCQWHDEMMTSSHTDTDPLWTVMREGGPFHAKGFKGEYVKRLKETGREKGAEELIKRYKFFN